MNSLLRHRGCVRRIMDPSSSQDFVRGDPVFGILFPSSYWSSSHRPVPLRSPIFLRIQFEDTLIHPTRLGFPFPPDRQTSDKPRPRPIDRQLSHMPWIPSPARQISAKCSAVCCAHWHSPSTAWGIFPLRILAIPHGPAVHPLGWGIFPLD